MFSLARAGPDADDRPVRGRSRQIWCGPAIAMTRAFVPGIWITSQGLFSAVVGAAARAVSRQ